MRVLIVATSVLATIYAMQLRNVMCRPLDGDVNTDETTRVNVTFTDLNNADVRSLFPMSYEMEAQVRAMSNTVWNLDLCEPGIQLNLGKEVLNKDGFSCSQDHAMKLAPMLFGDTLEDRVYVWCKLAALFSSTDVKNVTMMKTYDVKDLMYFEGDIILSRNSVDHIMELYRPAQGLQIRQKRKVNSSSLWPGFNIGYNFEDDDFNAQQREIIMAATLDWEEKTCIHFTPVNSSVHPRMTFTSRGESCYSSIGIRPGRATTVNIAEGCFLVGIVSHLIGHGLGLYHEHTRPDRDVYITVLSENISVGHASNFLKFNSYHINTYGVPYDYSSVMHYGAFDFAMNKENMTIRTNDAAMQQVIGQRVSVSFLDAKIINLAYCSDLCGRFDLEWEKCQNGGYRNPKNCTSCMCPEGLAPPFCERPSKGVNDDCGSQIRYATSAEKRLTSPGFYTKSGFNSSAYCSWMIRALTPGKRVRVRFSGKFYIYKDPSLNVCEDMIEVRYKDLSLPGPRHCDNVTPTVVYYSHGPELLVTAQTLDYFSGWQGFQAFYVEEHCGGCSVDSTNKEPVCLRTVRYSCSFQDCSSCEPTNETCVRDEKYCCDGFTRSGEDCNRNEYTTLPKRDNVKFTTTIKSTKFLQKATSFTRTTAKTAATSTTTTTAKQMIALRKPTTSIRTNLTSRAKQTTPTTKPMAITTKPYAKQKATKGKSMTSRTKLLTPRTQSMLYILKATKPMTSTTKLKTSTTNPTTSTTKPLTSTAKGITSAAQQTTMNMQQPVKFAALFLNS